MHEVGGVVCPSPACFPQAALAAMRMGRENSEPGQSSDELLGSMRGRTN